MQRLKQNIDLFGGWDMCPIKASTLDILKFPNGDLVVNGSGNHRAVLAKELGLKSILANVHEVRYLD